MSDELLHEINNKLTKVTTVLLGANGDEGLVGDVKKAIEKCEENTKDLGKVRTKLYWLIGIIGGSGALGGGLWAGIS